VSLDKALISDATRCGASLLLSYKAKSIKIENTVAEVAAEVVEGRNIRTEKNLFGKVVVSAEGAQSSLTSQLGFQTPNPGMKLHATQFEMSNAKLDREDLVEIFLGKTYASGFFAWIIPTGSDSVRVGLASKLPRVHSLLSHFISHNRLVKDKLVKANIRKILGGNVLTGGPIQKTFAQRFLAVGDCAGQTKPTTGGGVITGGICARIASKVIVQSLLLDNSSEGFLKKYEEMWRGALGQEFLLMLQLRRLLNCLPDALISKLIRSGSRIGLGDLMERKGDIDLQSQLIKSLIRDPRIILGFVLSFLGII
jgi:flavin-dependent dehydrogenase